MEKHLLHRFFSNTATVEEEKQLVAWIEADPEHQKELLKERRIFDLTIMANGEAGAGLRRKRSYPLFRIRELVKIAAVAILVWGMSFYFYSRTGTEKAVPLSTIAVPAGQRINLTLPDGTNVWMNARSEIRYPAVFSGEARTVELKGEAWFDVTHTGTPFVVETGKYAVEVLGTTFNLDANPDVTRFSASLIEGKVRVINRDHPDEEVMLEPSEQVYVSEGRLTKQAIADFDVFRWRDGLFCFKNMSFSALLESMEKYYDVRFVLQKAAFPREELSGKIRISDGVEHALRVLQKNIPFTYEKQENLIYIR